MKIILSIIAILLIAALGFCWYLGVFEKIIVSDTEEGGYTVVGTDYTGPYSKCGSIISEVNEKMIKMGATSTKGFGIYYDDPKTTPAEKCRSFVGNILEEKDRSKISELKSAGLKIDSVSKSSSAVAEFPLRSNLSYMVGPVKVYPALSKYINENKYKVTRSMEMYDMPGKKIIFIMQYSK